MIIHMDFKRSFDNINPKLLSQIIKELNIKIIKLFKNIIHQKIFKIYKFLLKWEKYYYIITRQKKKDKDNIYNLENLIIIL